MNSDVMHSIVQDGQGQRAKRTLLEPQILERLITEVKETVVTDVEYTKARTSSFSAVKLWNLRRNSRYAAHPRNKKPRIINGFGY